MRAGEEERVRGHVAPPALAHQPRGARGRIRRDHAQRAAGGQQLPAPVEAGGDVVEVLDDVGEDDHVEGLGLGELGQRGLLDGQPQAVARVPQRGLGELQAQHLVGAPARLVEQEAGAAAHVEQALARPSGSTGGPSTVATLSSRRAAVRRRPASSSR